MEMEKLIQDEIKQIQFVSKKDVKFINNVEIQILKAIHYFYSLDKREDQICIYMPEYFSRMFMNKMFNKSVQYEKPIRYCGIEVLAGYENAIIISVKNNISFDIKPIKISISKL